MIPRFAAEGHLRQTSTPSLEIANAISRLHKEFVGRGPTNVRTTIDGDLVVCLLEGGYTKAEQTLEENDKADLVAAGRLGLQDAMRDAMIAAVETHAGPPVRSFMSANDLQPEPPGRGVRAASRRTSAEDRSSATDRTGRRRPRAV